MALSITHSYVSAVPDAGDASLVQPSDWNDTHDITGLGTGVEAALAVNLGSAGAVLISTSTIPLTIGSSTIASGTDTRILYNNAGVLGQYTLTGTGTVVAMQTAPSFLTSITTPIATITQGEITASAPQINGTVTWNEGSTTFTGWKLNVTSTASATASMLMDLQVGGSSIMALRKDGNLTLPESDEYDPGLSSVNGLQFGTGLRMFQYNGSLGFANAGNDVYTIIGAVDSGVTGVKVLSDGALAFSSHALKAYVAPDVLLRRDAAATLALRNSTNAQTFRIYNTESSSLTNYERLSMYVSSNVWYIESQGGGTGTARSLRLSAGDTPGGAGGFLSISPSGAFDFALSGTATWWQISSSGHFLAGDDNVRDIGASGATRPRTLYLGTMLRTPKIETPRVSELTIATGAITVTGSYHDVDTEADDATDDLATINGGTDGMRLVLRANNSGRTVVVKDGTGNIQCAGDMSLDNIQDTIELIYDGVQTAWLEIGRSDNGA
jgi:hypothetical protein